MSEWIIQEKIISMTAEYQHKLSIESNWIVETFLSLPFAVVVIVFHSLSLFPSIRDTTTSEESWADLLLFIRIVSHQRYRQRIARFLFPIHPPPGSRDEYKCHIELHWCCCCLDSSKRQKMKLGKYQISRIILTLLCCAAMAASKLMMIFNRPIFSRARDDDESFPCSSVTMPKWKESHNSRRHHLLLR